MWIRRAAAGAGKTVGRLALGMTVAGILLGLGGCDYLPLGYTRVAAIVAAPAAFEGGEVKVKGEVVDVTKIPLIDIKQFVLRDGKADISVTAHGALPALHSTVALKGKVENAAIFDGRSIGLHITEIQRLPLLFDLDRK